MRLPWMQTMKVVLLFVIIKVSAVQPRRILIDTDVDIDDVFGLFYLLKQNKSEFDLQAITVNANGWSDVGHAVNHVYDILFMMGRDDIPVGVGGEGGIFPNATILPNVGGYLPIVDQVTTTAGECRYRQAIPLGRSGRLDISSNYGLRRAFLPQGDRGYIPLRQTTAQQVMIDAISAGPTTVFLMGAHTNLALFLMTNPHLKKNVEHIYAMGGSIGPNIYGQIGNLYPQDANPYAEFNIFSDPFAAYEVLHSGIPITLIPLDATRTIPIDENFFAAFEQKQDTYEAQYSFQTLKMVRDTWLSSDFHKQYCMWDSFMVGVALSEMRNSGQSHDAGNEFAEMEYMNITVVTSNKPYGISDGSNPLISERLIPKFGVHKNGVHSGHIQQGMQDPFCLEKGKKGKCRDGYTKKEDGEEAVQVLIATKAKPNRDKSSSLGKEFSRSFLDVINQRARSGRFNITKQFPNYKETLHKPDSRRRIKGKGVVFDMDMSVGDFLALFYLLKLPVELIDLKGILINANGWASAATIDVVYDVLHMMGRDDVPVGLGDVFAIGQYNPAFPALGDCTFRKSIPHGCGGFLDSDTLYGLARHLPRGPRSYTAENSVKFGAPRDTDHPELRQPSALNVWKTIAKSLNPEEKISVLTNGPLTNLAQIILSDQKISSVIKDIYIVGGQISHGKEEGNLFTVPSNKYAEFNMYLDPLAAKTVVDSKLNITLIPLYTQKPVSSFHKILNKLKLANRTPEAVFARRLLLRLRRLQRQNKRYRHTDMFLGEILGAVVLAAENHPQLKQTFEFKSLKILADGDTSKIGQIIIDEENGKKVKVLESVNPDSYYDQFANQLGDQRQSAVIGSYDEQKRMWSGPPKTTHNSSVIYEANLLVGSVVLMLLFAVYIKRKAIGK